MCDYSLHNVRSRPAKVGDKLTTRKFDTGTTGFCAPEDASMAVCLLPGTELSFEEEVWRVRLWPWSKEVVYHKTAIFRQIDQHDLALRARTPNRAWARRAVGEGVKSCPRAGCGKSACPVRVRPPGA